MPDESQKSGEQEAEKPPLLERVKRFLFGSPRSLEDRSLFRRLSLIPFLAWVGLGADGLSSSSYGPEEAFRALGEHTYLAVGLAALTALTVIVISAAYSRIIEEFPHGGGGYVVATKLLGRRVGAISGSALLVDYVLTIAVSIAAAGDALFSFLPLHLGGWRLPSEFVFIVGLTILNIRGVRESVLALMPIFLLFLVTHVIAIGGGIIAHAPQLPATASAVQQGFRSGLDVLGAGGLFLLFMHAYSLGGGTYTGIEAVSNGLPIMREPKVQTGKRTMLYMAASLAITAAGLIVCYLLWNVHKVPNRTMNASFVERLTEGLPGGQVFVILTLLSEGALLIVASQTGFLAGPRVLANMALDSWVPRHFATLSERLTTQNGIVLMGAASLLVLIYTRGSVYHLVIMYSINVFLTFSLSMFAMARSVYRTRRSRARWKRRLTLFSGGFLLCATILVITTVEKFREGGWLTLALTSALIALCFLINSHYRLVGSKLQALYAELGSIPEVPGSAPDTLDRTKPTAAVLVASFGGLGIHTLLNVFRAFPAHFKNVVFISVGVIGSGEFKGEGAVAELKEQTEAMLRKYVDLAHKLGLPATYRLAVGTDAVSEAEKLCLETAKEFPQVTFFAGKIIFQRDRWYQRLLHNDTAFAVQKRLQWAGRTMVILPARVR